MVITARYAGKCGKCGGKITPGASINWERGRDASHVQCPIAKPKPVSSELTWRLSGGEGYGYTGWTQAQIVHSNERLLARGYPEWLYVLSAGSQYYREEGMSFGVGDESGRVYWADCRQATPEEAAPAMAALEERQAARARAQELESIIAEFRSAGEMPHCVLAPEGQRLLDTFDVYGGGSTFIIGADDVWFIQANGADGDDWSRSNAVIGIGYRVAKDAPVAVRLLALLETRRNRES